MENKVGNNTNLSNQNPGFDYRVDDAKKEGLKKGALTTAIISLIILLVVGTLLIMHHNRVYNDQVTLMANQQKSFNEQLTARDSTISDWLNTFDQVEQNLNEIKQREKMISMNTTGSEISKDKKNQVLEDVKAISKLLDENKKKIAQLNARLNESGTKIKGLQERITTLEASMQQYETEITDLKATLASKDIQIGQLNTNVTALQDTITHKDATISTQISKLNEAFIIYGTYKDLKEKGILTKEGGFLGLGRKEFLVKDFSDNMFSKIDVTTTKSIPVNSKNAKLITDHPTGSYEIVHEGDNKVSYIAIKDPDMFWKISKYAVVEIVK
jgi:predicted  nucleic acid-binding Zn-ribbon protein